MPKFYVFAYDDYYPYGGMDDLAGIFDDIEEAKRSPVIRPHDEDWRRYDHVVMCAIKDNKIYHIGRHNGTSWEFHEWVEAKPRLTLRTDLDNDN